MSLDIEKFREQANSIVQQTKENKTRGNQKLDEFNAVYEQIKHMLDSNVSQRRVVEALNANGLKITQQTFRSYLTKAGYPLRPIIRKKKGD